MGRRPAAPHPAGLPRGAEHFGVDLEMGVSMTDAAGPARDLHPDPQQFKTGSSGTRPPYCRATTCAARWKFRAWA
jgi:hypothetical protein